MRTASSGRELPSRDAYLTRWAALHGGYDPRGSRLVHGWLALTYVLARPLAARRVPPDLVTLVGVLVGGAALAPAAVGGRWLLLAALVVVVSGLLDNLDGAVAVLTRRATRWGYVLDSVADRVTDLIYVAALWQAGAPGPLAALGGALAGLQEYARARAGASGLSEVGVVTVFERPTRVIVTAVFLACAGAYRNDLWVGLGAAAWVGLGVAGLAQLLILLRRRLR